MSGQAPENPVAILPAIRPVVVWLTAVKAGDQERLKTVYSERMRAQFDREGWDTVVRRYQEGLEKEFGDYRPEDFSLVFSGDEKQGTVSIAFKGRTQPPLRVINEKNSWKIDER